MDNFDFQDYTSTFANDTLELFQGCDFDFDRSELGLPEFDFENLSATLLESGTNSDINADHLNEFQWNFDLVSADLPLFAYSGELGSFDSTENQLSQTRVTDLNCIKRCLTEQSPVPCLEDDNVVPKRRKWNESVIVFSADPTAQPVQRIRRAFNPSRKKEVALNRAIGACILCKLKKGPCNFGIPCNNCIKRAGSLALGQEICTRKSLVATRFDFVDLFQTAQLDQRVHELGMPSVTGIQRDVYLCYPLVQGSGSYHLYVKLPVVDFENAAFTATQSLAHITYYSYQTFDVPNEPCAIPWESLQIFEQFVKSERVLQFQKFTGIGPFTGLQKAMVEFANCYIGHTKDLKLQNFLTAIMRMRCLFDMYYEMPLMTSSLESDKNEFASRAIYMQLRLVIAKVIVELEVEILSEIDKSARGTGALGRRSPIVFWVCLLLLIFSYKGQMVYAKAFIRDRHKLLSLSQHLYNAVISIYATLYKTTSPLILDWRTEEVATMLGNDPELIRLFCNIKTEMYWFYAERDRLFPEDNLFKTLVLENESKLLESHKKKARRQGLL